MYGVGAHCAQKAVEDDKPAHAKPQHEFSSQAFGEDKGIDQGKFGESQVKSDQIGAGQGGDSDEKAACQVRDVCGWLQIPQVHHSIEGLKPLYQTSITIYWTSITVYTTSITI